MKKLPSKLKFFAAVIMLFIVPASNAVAQELPGGITIDPNFGGTESHKRLRFCLIPAPPPIFTIPLPFQYIEVDPAQADFIDIGINLSGEEKVKLYYVFGVSRTYRRDRNVVEAKVIGKMIPQADDAFRVPCINSDSLPDADGIILYIGTSCAPLETPGSGKCKL